MFNLESELLSRSAAELTPLVRRALDLADGAALGDISAEWQQLSGGVGGGIGGTAVYRVSGTAQVDGQPRRWSLIAKLLVARPDEAPHSSHYWRREASIYRYGLLEDLPGTLAAPRSFGVEDLGDAACLVWMEAVQDDSPLHWSLREFGLAARHLGEFNGAYLAGETMPDVPWLSRDWIRQDVARFASQVSQLEPYRRHEAIRRWLPDEIMTRAARLWDDRHVFLDALDRLPQTLCHYDAFRRNLLIRQRPDGSAQTVAVDWSFLGGGPLGAELVALFWVSYVFAEARADQTQELDACLFENYVEGLRTAGWRGDPRLARLGYTAAMGLRRLAGMAINAPVFASLIEAGGSLPPERLDCLIAAGAKIERGVEEARALIDMVG
ncbi:MAG: phosphotransferase [Anaerolineae bacterium]|nr:phosphotransferase [Anaerolineae bacterium]